MEAIEQRSKRNAPSSKHGCALDPAQFIDARLDSLHFPPFEKGGADSPSLAPASVKRHRLPLPVPLALADAPLLVDHPRCDPSPSPTEIGMDSHDDGAAFTRISSTVVGPNGRDVADFTRSVTSPLNEPASSSSSAPQSSSGCCPVDATSSASAVRAPANGWRIVLYHDRHLVMYNPNANPQFRSRRASFDDNQGAGHINSSLRRCPLCRQVIDARFAFAASAYFELLQKQFNCSSAFSSTFEVTETGEDIDVLIETDLYRILGVASSAPADDIKRAYRKQSLRYHPDKNPDDPKAKMKFQKVAEAFSVLSEENKRAKYDSSGDMDLDGFDVEQFAKNVEKFVDSELRKHQQASDSEMTSGDLDCAGDVTDAIGEHNPYVLSPAGEEKASADERASVDAVKGSDGGVEARAAAASELKNLPPNLLITGYYDRFFEQLQHLGGGSFGQVYLCRHWLDTIELGNYAVKKVPVGDNKVWLRDMVREVKTFERLHHQNIVEYKHSWLELSRISEFCPFVPFLFILMQFCNGGSLGELIWHGGDPQKPRSPIPPTTIWILLRDMLCGLEHLHSKGILHRDLKPFNVLLDWAERPSKNRQNCPTALLSDFGTATPFRDSSASATGAGVSNRGYTGTVEYNAPELMNGGGKEDYTEKSDMWSLGIVLYAMCWRKLPFSDEKPSVIKQQVLQFVAERKALPRDKRPWWLPPDKDGALGHLRHVVAACTDIDPKRRPATTDLLENREFNRQVNMAQHRDQASALPALDHH